MARNDFVKDISIRTGIIQEDVELVLTTFLDLVRDGVSQGQSIVLKEFGTFKARTRPEKIARNLKGKVQGKRKNPEPMILPATRVPHFKPSKQFLKVA